MKVPEQYRMKTGRLATTKLDGNNGVFIVKHKKHMYYVIASDGDGWDHVSVTVCNVSRVPTWKEMNMIKDLFFHPEETAYQIHPPHSEYVNNHEYCLHLWRPQGPAGEEPRPPIYMV